MLFFLILEVIPNPPISAVEANRFGGEMRRSPTLMTLTEKPLS